MNEKPTEGIPPNEPVETPKAAKPEEIVGPESPSNGLSDDVTEKLVQLAMKRIRELTDSDVITEADLAKLRSDLELPESSEVPVSVAVNKDKISLLLVEIGDRNTSVTRASENDLETERGRKVEEIAVLAKELCESGEVFPFPGVDPEEYLKMIATDEKYPGFTTPTKELLERLRSGGMKVVLGDDPKSGNVYIVPAQGIVTAEDTFLFPRQLQITAGMDERLKRLISINLSFYRDSKK